ncbi:LLM class flavin-dependent oxidoreductase [Egibacter rhizosphaerae]|uniref:LLM class flavin-dependent oxidoreductase n=1 Tax=Egibacter rhizosphaerae TaxID=1670831 RepID=A0A411YB55_9ACTN|nr:LLM class flavin-dependent oxidoreductase [Egibacter rhizosphaerae]QBI18408.1 LLM class flavin-dependent oxidoreductase [Egibacter rhizosphaerae]
MDVGIGIPNSIPGTPGGRMLEWARRAEAAGFSTLATIGAVEFPTYEELTALAAAGAVTERIGLLTNVLIAPPRSSAELAKQAATVDQLSGGRLTLGLGVGWRATDYQLTGRDFETRGQRFDAQLHELLAAWRGEPLVEGSRPITPQPTRPEGVPLLIGGNTDAAIRRAAEVGIGWTAGGLPPDTAKEWADRVRTAWHEAGRSGEPRLVALVYFGLGDVGQRARDYALDYYGPMGTEVANMIADSILRDPESVAQTVGAFADAGFDELILDPTVADVDQVDLLADATR